MNQNILNWFKLILNERFGIELNIKKNNKNIIISNEEFEGSIIFDNLEEKFFQFNSNISCAMWNPAQEGFQSITKQPLYAPTSKPLKLPIIDKKSHDYFIHYDILGLVFWSLNRLEEINSENTDQYGRFDYKFSHAFIHGYHNEPIIDYWFNILSQVFLKIWPKIKLKKNFFRIELSHDVDRPFLGYGGKNFHSYLRNTVSSFYHSEQNMYGNLFLSHFGLNNSNYQKDPYDSFDWLMDVAEKNNLKSTFNFLFGGSHFRDAYYSIEHKKIKLLISKITQRNHYIGAHLSYRCFDNNQMINRELGEYKYYLKSNNITHQKLTTRMHYLKWKSPNTLKYLDEAGVHLDTSMGYSGSPGFRCGTCHIYTGYDPINHKVLNIKVSPLVLMDTTLTNNKKLDDKYNIAIDLKNKCKKVNGKFTLLWHNCNLVEEKQKNLFKSLL